MKKQEFIARLRARLGGLPKGEAEERLNFYSEMIDDRVEDGLSEEQAVMAIGSADVVAAQVLSEANFETSAKRSQGSTRKMRTWEIILLAVGSPVWVSLLITFFAVVFSFYAALWSVIISLWAGFAALIGSAIGVLAGGACFAVMGYPLTGIASVGASLVCMGITVLWFFGCKAATKGAALLTKWIVLLIPKCFRRKENLI